MWTCLDNINVNYFKLYYYNIKEEEVVSPFLMVLTFDENEKILNKIQCLTLKQNINATWVI
jgi:hypothetical protein